MTDNEPGLDYDVVDNNTYDTYAYVVVHGTDPALDEADLLALLYALQDRPTP